MDLLYKIKDNLKENRRKFEYILSFLELNGFNLIGMSCKSNTFNIDYKTYYLYFENKFEDRLYINFHFDEKNKDLNLITLQVKLLQYLDIEVIRMNSLNELKVKISKMIKLIKERKNGKNCYDKFLEEIKETLLEQWEKFNSVIVYLKLNECNLIKEYCYKKINGYVFYFTNKDGNLITIEIDYNQNFKLEISLTYKDFYEKFYSMEQLEEKILEII